MLEEVHGGGWSGGKSVIGVGGGWESKRNTEQTKQTEGNMREFGYKGE